MNLFTDLLLFARLDHLFRTRATGTPLQMAARLDICVRNVYRLIDQFRDYGFPIAYDKQAETYYYTAPVELRIHFKVAGQDLLDIKGG